VVSLYLEERSPQASILNFTNLFFWFLKSEMRTEDFRSRGFYNFFSITKLLKSYINAFKNVFAQEPLAELFRSLTIYCNFKLRGRPTSFQFFLSFTPLAVECCNLWNANYYYELLLKFSVPSFPHLNPTHSLYSLSRPPSDLK
jgi:hypothetical protein